MALRDGLSIVLEQDPKSLTWRWLLFVGDEPVAGGDGSTMRGTIEAAEALVGIVSSVLRASREDA